MIIQPAAEAGNPAAMHGLGVSYETGGRIDKNSRKAAERIFKAIKAGNDCSVIQMFKNERACSRQFRREFQQLLREEGKYDGRVDGSFGGILPGGNT